jgi:hypothetical protein
MAGCVPGNYFSTANPNKKSSSQGELNIQSIQGETLRAWRSCQWPPDSRVVAQNQSGRVGLLFDGDRIEEVEKVKRLISIVFIRCGSSVQCADIHFAGLSPCTPLGVSAWIA